MSANRNPLCVTILFALVACSSSSQPAQDAGNPSQEGQMSDDGSSSTPDAVAGDDGSTPATDSASESAAPTCDLSSAITACETCTLTSCCAESQACLNDPDCQQYYRCMRLTIEGVDAGACAVDGGATTGEYMAYDACLRSSCATSCAVCHGTALPCSAYANQTVCEAVGCGWVNPTSSCTGTLPPICSLFTDSTKCTEAGCQWSY